MKRNRRNGLKKLAAVLAEGPASPRAGFAAAWQEAVQELPDERMRIMVEERYVQGLSCIQIAARHGLTRQRVYQILTEAMAILKKNQKLQEQIEKLPVEVMSYPTPDDIRTAYDYQRMKSSRLWQDFLASLSKEQKELLEEYRKTRAAIERLERWLMKSQMGEMIRNAHELAFYLPQS